MNPVVSFVLPAFKRRFLKEAMESILAQTFCDFELVIVDDCSPENLKEIVGGFKDGRISYFRNETNLGRNDLVGSWMNAIGRARGEWIVLASDDDVYEPRYLERMLALAAKYPSVDLVHCRLAVIDERGAVTRLGKSRPEYESGALMLYNCAVRRKDQRISDLMMRRTALDAIGGLVRYPLAWFSDHDTAILLAEKGGAACSDEALFKWRESTENISSRRNDTLDKIRAGELHRSFLKAKLKTFKAESAADRRLLFKTRLLLGFSVTGLGVWVLNRVRFRDWRRLVFNRGIPFSIRLFSLLTRWF